jgi:multiple sugar transport system substrate-binding protein
VAFIKLAPGFLPGSAASAHDPQYSQSDGTPQGDASVLAWKDLETAVNFTPPFWTDAMDKILKEDINKAITGQMASKAALDDAVSKCNALLTE